MQLRRVEAAISFSGNGHLAPVFYVRLVIDMATSKLTYQEKQAANSYSALSQLCHRTAMVELLLLRGESILHQLFT